MIIRCLNTPVLALEPFFHSLHKTEWKISPQDGSIVVEILLHTFMCFYTLQVQASVFPLKMDPLESASKPKCSCALWEQALLLFPWVMLYWACLTAGQTETNQLLQYQVRVSPIPVSSTHSPCLVGSIVSTHGRHRLDEGLENLRKIWESDKKMVIIHPEHLRKEQKWMSQWLIHSAKIWDRDQSHNKGANFKYLPP